MALFRNIVLLIAVVLSLVACDESSHKDTKIQNGVAYITLPPGYTKMSRDLLKTKFPHQTPSEGYGTADTTSSFVFTMTNNKVSEQGLSELGEMMRIQFSDYDPIISDIVVDKKKTIMIKVTTPASDGMIDNVMLFTSLGGKVFLASFNSMHGDKDRYYANGEEALRSIKWN